MNLFSFYIKYRLEDDSHNRILFKTLTSILQKKLNTGETHIDLDLKNPL